MATLARQIHVQAKDGGAKGVSTWLFVGQIAASLGFIAYSLLVKKWVFVATNTAILITSVIGQRVVARHAAKRQQPD